MDDLRARKVTTEDFVAFDLLLAMDQENQRELLDMAHPGTATKVKLFLEFAPDAGTLDVPDPYYGGDAGFDRVLDLVEAASEGLLETLDA